MIWGLIGASTIASQFMINAIRRQSDHSIKSVLSSDAVRGAAYASDHDIPHSITNLDEMLGDPEIGAVYISTTNEKHKAQALAAIEAGKHVMCEKPLAMNVADASEMVSAATKAGVIFGTNHHLRNAGSHIKIKNMIQAGEIGKVLSIRIFHAVYLPENLQGWRIDNAAAGGGVIPDIVVHDADTVRFYLEEDPYEVVAIDKSEAMGQGVEDSVMSIWTMPSGVMVQTHEAFTHAFAPTGIEIHGTDGSIIARNVMTQKPVGEITLSDKEGIHKVNFDDHDLYTRSMSMFAAAIKGEGHPSANGMDGIKSLAVAVAVKASTRDGKSVVVDYQGV